MKNKLGMGILGMAILAGCADLSVQDRVEHANGLANQHGWHLQAMPAGDFTLAAYIPENAVLSERLTVYIEGDGLAWVSASQASLDPTPRHPVALQMALRHQAGTAVYLARPCQYIRSGNTCRLAYWTNRRFSEEVIVATDLAVSQLKSQFGARTVELIGYSGGGAVAALVAARRNDVLRLVTVAGNLDHRAWTRLHRIAPLTHSLNPVESWPGLQAISQVHFVGEQDDNITPALLFAYRDHFPAAAPVAIHVVPGQTHECCWDQVWPALQAVLSEIK